MHFGFTNMGVRNAYFQSYSQNKFQILIWVTLYVYRLKNLPSFRYLSAERARNNWLSAAKKITPGIEHLDDDEVDFLAASISSQKTICSNAFDFLFDSTNLNPDKQLQEQIDMDEKSLENQNVEKVKSSACCVIS